MFLFALLSVSFVLHQKPGGGRTVRPAPRSGVQYTKQDAKLLPAPLGTSRSTATELLGTIFRAL